MGKKKRKRSVAGAFQGGVRRVGANKARPKLRLKIEGSYLLGRCDAALSVSSLSGLTDAPSYLAGMIDEATRELEKLLTRD